MVIRKDLGSDHSGMCTGIKSVFFDFSDAYGALGVESGISICEFQKNQS